MWSDNETDLDFLNYSETADLVAELLAIAELRPLSVGIFGGWGVGKSSLLKLIERRLATNANDYLVLSFDAWLFQDFDDARAALLQSIGNALLSAAEKNESLTAKVTNLLGRVRKLRAFGLVAELGAAAMGYPTMGAISRGFDSLSQIAEGNGSAANVGAIEDAGKAVVEKGGGLLKPKEARSPPDEIFAFRTEFADVLKGLGKTLVVFIDNLDRCLPRNAILTLEAVRLFLFLPQTTFVIAADEDMIRFAVSEHYKATTKRLITDYLDKLVQIPIHVPRAGVAEVRAYLLMLLLMAQKGEKRLDPKRFENVRHILEVQLRASWTGKGLTAKDIEAALRLPDLPAQEILDGVSTSYHLAERMAPLLASSKRVAGNPRIIKRMLNTIRMRMSVAKRRGMPLDEALIAKLVLFERCAGDSATNELFRLISVAPEGKSPELKMLEEAKGAAKVEQLPLAWREEAEFINEWATLEPSLSSLDLRPAAYLAREILPMRITAEGLTAEAASAIRSLLGVSQASSPTGIEIAKSLAADQREPAIRAITAELAKVNDWKSPPPGFYGAVLIADLSPEAGKILAAFLKGHLNRSPAWMAMALKKKSWWGG